MRFLITNDDGVDAEGLQALVAAASAWGEVTIVAPDRCHSSGGHSVTTHRPLELRELAPRKFALEGSPADCVRVALLHVVPDVDWVLAGINHGGNLGADVHVSGTVAAVREAALLGKCGIAFSQYRKRNLPLDWNLASTWARRVLADLVAAERLPPGRFWNVNLPHLERLPAEPDALPPRVVCPLDPNPLPVRFEVSESADGVRRFTYASDYHTRKRRSGGDVETCFGGAIAVTELRLP